MKTSVTKSPRFYQKAAFPWLIIFTLAVFTLGLALGWTMRSNHYSEIKAEVHAQVAEVQTLKAKK